MSADSYLPKLISPSTNPGGIDKWYGNDLQNIRHALANSRTITASTVTLANDDKYVVCNTASNNVTITIPTAATRKGKHFIIIKSSASNTLTVTRSGSDTVYGQTSIKVSRKFEGVELVSDGGTAWNPRNPPGLSRGTYYVDDPEFGAVGDGTTDDTIAIQACVDAAGSGNTARKIVFSGSKTYIITSPIQLKYDAIVFDMQGATLKAGTGWTGSMMIALGRNTTGDTAAIDHMIVDGYIDMNSKACDGISNILHATYNPTGFDTTDKAHKFGHISRVRFKNNAAGQAMIYLRNLENMWEFFHNQLDPILLAGSYGFRLENQGHNGGNISIMGNMIASQAGPSHTGIKCISIEGITSPYNRVKIIGNHMFNGNNGIGNYGIYGNVTDDGGVDSNRSWFIIANGIEDFKFPIFLQGEITGTDSGMASIHISDNSLEIKNTTYEVGATCITIGNAVSANIHDNLILVKTAATETQTGISVDATTGYENLIHSNEFRDKTAGGTFNKIVLTSGTTRVWRNYGEHPYVTEASGTNNIANGGSSRTVTHGCSYTPARADITITLGENPTNTPGAIWVDTIGTTTFDVNCENDPGASNLDFSWSVRKVS